MSKYVLWKSASIIQLKNIQVRRGENKASKENWPVPVFEQKFQNQTLCIYKAFNLRAESM